MAELNITLKAGIFSSDIGLGTLACVHMIKFLRINLCFQGEKNRKTEETERVRDVSVFPFFFIVVLVAKKKLSSSLGDEGRATSEHTWVLLTLVEWPVLE